MSTIADTKGLLIRAGSRPIERNKSGSREPTSYPISTTVRIVAGMMRASMGDGA